MYNGVEAARLERLASSASRPFVGDVAGDNDNLFFDVMIEPVAEMFAQRGEYRRVENLAAKTAIAAAPVAANQQVDAVELGMPSQEDREERFAKKSCRAGQQDATALEYLLKRRHRGSFRLPLLLDIRDHQRRQMQVGYLGERPRSDVAIAIALSSVSAASHPSRAATSGSSHPAAITRPTCCRAGSPQYHM